MSNISTVPFHGTKLITAKLNEIVYVAMRPIVENIGLDWPTQYRKLQKTQQKHGCCHMTTPTKSGIQSMLFIPLRKLNGWLFSINPEKVREDLREKVIQYQEECFEVLFKHFMPKVAERQKTISLEQQEELQQAVMDLYKASGEHYQHIYGRLTKKFKIPRYRELLAKDFKAAIAFLQYQPKALSNPHDTDMD